MVIHLGLSPFSTDIALLGTHPLVYELIGVLSIIVYYPCIYLTAAGI